MENNNYKRTVAGSIGAGMASVFNASGRMYYILEHKTESQYHHAGESQKIIVDQVELGRDASCQVRFDESFETVSRRHAAIVKDGEGWKIINLSQTNATYVNGQPIASEWALSSGDEIRLSSRGPVMGFIVPQGRQSMVKSIGLTERMNLFRKQALRPYKTALIILALVLVLAVAALVLWNMHQSRAYEEKLQDYEEQMMQVESQMEEKDANILDLQNEIRDMNDKNSEEYGRLVDQLVRAREDRRQLEERSRALQNDLNSFKKETRDKEELDRQEREQREQEEIQRQIEELEEAERQKELEEQSRPRTIEEIINSQRRSDPEIK